MKRTPIVLAILALGGGAAAWFVWRPPAIATATTADASTFAVRRGDLDITVVENGTLVAKESRKVTPEFRGDGKIIFLLEEGKAVQEGDVVCRIDTTEIDNQIEQQEMEVVQAEAAHNTAVTEREIQVTDNAATIEKAQITQEFVRMELEKFRDGDAPQDRRRLEVAIKDAETEHRRTKKIFEDSKLLVEQNFIKRSELEQDEIQFEKATVRLEADLKALELFDKYTRPMSLRKFTNAVTDAERDLADAQKRAANKLNQRDADLLSAEKRLKRIRQQLTERRKDREGMTLKAPCPGILIYGDPHDPWNRGDIKVGGTIWGSNTLMTIPDLRVMQVKIEVHEADVNKVAVDQRTTVTMDTYPGLVLHGHVARVANIAAAGNPWAPSSTEVKRFDVEIVLEGNGGVTLKPGISAKATIHIDTRRNALHVPLQSVFEENGAQQCFVLGDAGPVRRDIKAGLANDSYIEILSGLEIGERVLLHNPFLGQQGADGTPVVAPAPDAAPVEADAGKPATAPAAVEAAVAPGASAAMPPTPPTAPAADGNGGR